MIIVRCKECNKEIKSNTQTQTCGCPNMLTVTDDAFSARDMSQVIVVKSYQQKEKEGLTSQDLQWQEQRRKRKVRKMDFEIR